MNNLGRVNLYDFYFNGHYVSDFSGTIAGREGWKDYNLLPSRTDKTQRTINADGEHFLRSTVNPRTFTVPVLWESIQGMQLRNIAGWLDVDSPKTFYIAGDDLKLNCKLDTSEVPINTFLGIAGINDLKFIAHDPFFYEVHPKVITVVNNSILNNMGNKECFPKIEITTSALSTVTITFKQSGITYCQFVLTGMNGYLCIDSDKYTVENSSEETLFNLYSLVVGDSVFPYLKTGQTTIEITGSSITSVIMTPNFRWI